MKARMVAILSFLFFHTPSVWACPLCKEAVEKMGEVWTSIGFNWSIYVMMAVPYLVIAIFAAVLYVKYRKHSRKGHP